MNITARLALEEGQTVANLLTRLCPPPGEARRILVDGENQSVDHALSAGDVVSVLPPVAGG